MRLLSIAAGSLAVAMSLAAAPVYAATCQQLWVERNQIYKNHGYCFKTKRAIDYFGNGGCTVHNENALRLSAGEQNRIAQILRQESKLSEMKTAEDTLRRREPQVSAILRGC